MSTSRLVAAAVSLAACHTAGNAPSPATARSAALDGVDVQQVLIATPAPVPVAGDPASEMPPLQAQRTTIGLVMTSPLRCDLGKALELRELEGSILGSHGVEVAVTYFVPLLRAEHCERTTSTNEYRIAVDWERRTDTAWTIVVPGYRGTADRFENTALFAKRLTGHQADAATQAALASLPKLGEHPIESMTNAGRIVSVTATRDSTDIVIAVTVQYGNSCEAGTPWRIEPTVWRPDANGVAHVFATLARPATSKTCGEIAEFGPAARATSHVRLAAPSGARALQVVVPNVARADQLPVFTTDVALR